MSLPYEMSPSITGSNTYSLTINNKDEILEEGESFALVLYIDRNVFANDELLVTKVEETQHDEEEEEEGKQ